MRRLACTEIGAVAGVGDREALGQTVPCRLQTVRRIPQAGRSDLGFGRWLGAAGRAHLLKPFDSAFCLFAKVG